MKHGHFCSCGPCQTPGPAPRPEPEWLSERERTRRDFEALDRLEGRVRRDRMVVGGGGGR